MISLLKCIKPYELESLASYLNRVSQNNVCDIKWLYNECAIHFPKHSIKLNYLLKDSSIGLVSELTKLNNKEIMCMTVHRFSTGLWDPSNVNLAQSDITIHVDLKYTKYCPICLKKKDYHRIDWHLKDIKVCLEHQTALIESCPRCAEPLTVSQIIKGRCKCRFNLKETELELSMGNKVLKSQWRLHVAFAIIGHYEDLPLSQTSRIEYLTLYSFLKRIIEPHLSKLHSIRNPFGLPQHNSWMIVEHYIEQVLGDWPKGLYSLLDDFNEMQRFDKEASIFLKESSTDPLGLIKGYGYPKMKFVEDALLAYLQTSFCEDFFVAKLSSEIVEKNYIRTSLANEVFGINIQSCEESSYIRYYDNRRPYINFRVVVEYISRCIKIGTVVCNVEGYVSISSLYSSFRFLGISWWEIIEIGLNAGVEFRINLTAEGFQMILLPKDKINILILEYVLAKMKNEQQDKC